MSRAQATDNNTIEARIVKKINSTHMLRATDVANLVPYGREAAFTGGFY